MSTWHPWHEAAATALLEQAGAGRLGHALLLAGPAGWGKRALARQLARALLGLPLPAIGSVEPGEEASDADLLSHPDARIVRREIAANSGRLRAQLVIEQVRSLGEFLARTASGGGRRVVVLERAEELNPNAANALLKSLEEPGADTHLLLVSDAPSRVLATIRSRCSAVALPPGSAEDASAWLAELSAGAGRAKGTEELDAAARARLLELAGGAPELAADLAARDALAVVDAVEAVLAGGAASALAVMPARADTDAQRAHADLVLLCLYRALARRAREAGSGAGEDLRLLTRVQSARQMLQSTANPNVTLLLEDLLLPLARRRRG